MPVTGSLPAAALILAGGRGARMKSRRPAAVHAIAGRSLAGWSLALCRSLGVERVAAVVGSDAAAVGALLGPDVELVEQPEPRGTGHAAAAAASLLEGLDGPLLVLAANSPLLTGALVREMLAVHAEAAAAATLIAGAPGCAGVARLLRGEGGEIRAARETGPVPAGSPGEGGEPAGGAWLFDPAALAAALAELPADPASGEMSLWDVVSHLVERGARVAVARAADPEALLGVRDRVELARAAAVLRHRILRAHMENGVTVEDPSATYVDADVTIGPDTVLRPMTWLCGGTSVGEECDLGPSVRITDSILGNGVSAQSAVITDSRVGEQTRIGPFAQLRPGCRVGRKVKIGNFVELKNAVVEDGASLGHLAYVGDAFVGEKSNIGAGTITCNYDGKHKHPTHVGRGAFIGSHTTLVAPVVVGDGAYTAAGTVVTEDVPPEALAIGRSRQSTKPEWARRRRERLEQE